MGINTEFLSSLGLTEEQSKAIFAERGREIEENKKSLLLDWEKSNGDKIAEVESKQTEVIKGKDMEIADLKQQLADMEKTTQTLNSELDKAKTTEKEYLAKQTEREQAERFERALKDMGDKRFTHPAVKEKYFKMFVDKLVETTATATVDGEKTELPSDVELITSLVGEDKDAFVGVQRMPLYGGTPTRGGITRDEILSMKNREKRIKAMVENSDLFPEINKARKALL